jgi:hypothetical protein
VFIPILEHPNFAVRKSTELAKWVRVEECGVRSNPTGTPAVLSS